MVTSFTAELRSFFELVNEFPWTSLILLGAIMSLSVTRRFTVVRNSIRN